MSLTMHAIECTDVPQRKITIRILTDYYVTNEEQNIISLDSDKRLSIIQYHDLDKKRSLVWFGLVYITPKNNPLRYNFPVLQYHDLDTKQSLVCITPKNDPLRYSLQFLYRGKVYW